MSSILDMPGTNPPNPFTPIIDQYLAQTTTDSNSPTDTAKAIVDRVTTSPNPGNALYQLWDAFFNSIVRTPLVENNARLSFEHHLALLSSIRAHTPTSPAHPAVKAGSYREDHLLASGHLHRDENGSSHFDWRRLPLFPAQWRDTHDILESWRSWDGIRRGAGGQGTGTTTATATCQPAEFHTRFVTFSALMVQRQFETDRDGDGDGDAILIHPIWVFYAARGTLETDHPGGRRPGDGDKREVITREGYLAPEQLWQLDVKVAATWLRYGGRTLWGMDASSNLREHYATTLDWETDLWKRDGHGHGNREGGISTARWTLWAERLRGLMEGTVNQHYRLDRETRDEVEQASKVLEGLLLGEQRVGYMLNSH
ncbi:hypothetical protein QBC37DRAFT_430845 [Rhypophila decipiens]|uniref:Uncharacterized protein n=1 Tax=Rhypophila decipiens TaxID=261697 RepID=A0AAN7B3N3_9PEZI|nr:hypothetical protein QBC37DRAFT_430845 [Rhypophila decipiens]